ncbi:hypothetical protein [Natronobacterium texcoconense]|uniref:Uncharacterized protein n=1 Tax=Natronobacterium texcoconense TaxID=1095778 RepID=A0A1H1IY22_NATTX|nr:hypothetical protein [Natronobacterium texcoconense]SDR42559.1 hypothetical protein SAMN04489842_3906 [Natronobacterium texcoconense]
MSNWSPPEDTQVGEGNISALEASLPFDPHDLEIQRTEYVPQTYQRLSKKQRKRFEKYLNRNNDYEFDQVYSYLLKWKNPDKYDDGIAQSYERLAKEALGIPTQIRNGGEEAVYPNDQQIQTFKELYVASQCFLEIHFGTTDESATKTVYRGIRENSMAKIVAQAIDFPDSDRYYFKTSTVANFTGIEGIGHYHSDGILVKWRVPREKIILAADRLFNTPAHEDELQIAGGTILVEGNGVIHEGTTSGTTRRLQTVIQGMDSPESLNDVDHKDIADLVELMYHHDEPVTTTEGAERLEEWFYEVNSRELYSAMKTEALNAQVQYLMEAGQGNERDVLR